MGTRRQFSREFKLEAVKLVKERGVAVARLPAIWTCTRTCCAWMRELAAQTRSKHSQARA
jgi:transposase